MRSHVLEVRKRRLKCSGSLDGDPLDEIALQPGGEFWCGFLVFLNDLVETGLSAWKV
jgi:hypothetical protein